MWERKREQACKEKDKDKTRLFQRLRNQNHLGSGLQMKRDLCFQGYWVLGSNVSVFSFLPFSFRSLPVDLAVDNFFL